MDLAAHGLGVPEVHGVWGGLTEDERQGIYDNDRTQRDLFIAGEVLS